jgi:hypothetical protein
LLLEITTWSPPPTSKVNWTLSYGSAPRKGISASGTLSLGTEMSPLSGTYGSVAPASKKARFVSAIFVLVPSRSRCTPSLRVLMVARIVSFARASPTR